MKALECATCKRLQAPQKPRPSTAPRLHIGQFGDELQIDNFYLHPGLQEPPNHGDLRPHHQPAPSGTTTITRASRDLGRAGERLDSALRTARDRAVRPGRGLHGSLQGLASGARSRSRLLSVRSSLADRSAATPSSG